MKSEAPVGVRIELCRIAEVRDSGHKGRGLYALRNITRGELIDRSAGLFFSPAESQELLKTPIFDHLLANPDEFKTGSSTNTYALTMGDMTFCNHMIPNNAVIEWKFDKVGLWLELRAVLDIAVGQEITIKYTNLAEYDANIFSPSGMKDTDDAQEAP